MNILAIETSCDDTAAAILNNGRVLSNIIASQDEHIQYGGVVPELASRAHIAKIVPVVRRALHVAQTEVSAIDAVAATAGPGLIGSLMVGLTFAKSLAMARRVPFLGVHHIEGHLHSAALEHPALRPPFLCLVVSGGHTLLVHVRDFRKYELLGKTRDDAAGEAFDKVAKILHLPYPGGPSVETLAKRGDEKAIKFPVARLKGGAYDFSFSGLKTAVLYYHEALPENERERQRANIAAAFQKAVADALLRSLRRAAKNTGAQQVVLAGGVARNKYLARRASELAAERGFSIYIPEAQYCSDNAAMIGKVAALMLRRGLVSELAMPPEPNLALPGLF